MRDSEIKILYEVIAGEKQYARELRNKRFGNK